MKWTEKAPAKINLALDVLYKRDDGYHEVEMVMTTVDLADRIELTSSHDNRIQIFSRSQFIPDDHRNLAYKAAALLKKKCNINYGVMIELEKNIPVAAGLAGGSSDAAATLRGLNQLWKLGFSLDELAEIGAEIGSDVPFCIYGGTALAQGRGEKILHLPPPPRCWVILAKPVIGVSTADVYRSLALHDLHHPDIQGMVNALKEQNYQQMCSKIGNVLETVTLNMHPAVLNIKEHMYKFGADAALMSGSGPTVFGLTEYESKMHRIYNGLKGFCDQVYAVRILG